MRTTSATSVYHAILHGANKQQVFEDEETMCVSETSFGGKRNLTLTNWVGQCLPDAISMPIA